MPLVVQTGRSLTIEVNSVNYSAQTASVELITNQTVNQYVTLTSSAAISQPATHSVRVSAFQDWGEASSFAEALWTAAAAGTAVPFELTATGATFTGNLIPVYPTAGGAGDDVMMLDVTMQVSGSVTATFA